MYREWPTERSGVEFIRLQPPGRESRFREPVIQSYAELSEQIHRALLPYRNIPTGIFGHCSSAYSAYETILRFREEFPDDVPPRLFVSSAVAPQDSPYGKFLTMDRAQLVQEMQVLMLELGGRPNPGFLDIAVDILQADLQCNINYSVSEPTRLADRITTFGWSEDDAVEPARMAGWDRCGSLDSHLLPGGHYEFTHAPADLLDIMVSCLLSSERPTKVAGGAGSI